MADHTTQDLFLRLALAILIGLIVGIERGRHTKDRTGGERIAGVRTFAIVGLLGGVSGILSLDVGQIFLAAAFLGFAALVIATYVVSVKEYGDFGTTTEVAALVVFGLGALAVRGDMIVAAAGGVALTALLDAKKKLHTQIALLQRRELDAAVKILLISVVLLPILPDSGYGPGALLNPYRLWWMVVLVAGLSFIGYFMVRRAGPRRGVVVTAIAGGLASSTAVALGFSRLGKDAPALAPYLAGGILLATGMSFVRLWVIVGVIHTPLAVTMGFPLAAMSLVAFGFAYFFLRNDTKSVHLRGEDKVRFENPLELGVALQFGLFLAGIALASHYMRVFLGDQGLYVVAGLSGLIDIDAIGLSLAQMTSEKAEIGTVAAGAIVLAALVNTAVKIGLSVVFSDKTVYRRIILGGGGVIAAGSVSLALI